MLHVKLLENVHYISNYYRTSITCQTTAERTLHVNLLEKYVTCQITTECSLQVKLLQNVHYMLIYYRTYITCQNTTEIQYITDQTTKARTIHVKLLQNVQYITRQTTT